MSDPGAVAHAHVYVFKGVTPTGNAQRPTASKFQCSVTGCPYNPVTSGVSANQAMQIDENAVLRALQRLVVRADADGTNYLLISGNGKCHLCGASGDATTLMVPGNHTVKCGYRIGKLILAGSVKYQPDLGTLVDDDSSQ